DNYSWNTALKEELIVPHDIEFVDTNSANYSERDTEAIIELTDDPTAPLTSKKPRIIAAKFCKFFIQIDL
ncbi:hypothetical protein TSAR_003223, partial [Trichomalopsis sarcophagae]